MSNPGEGGADGGARSQRKRLWPFVLLALLISIICAGGYVVSHLSEMARPDGTPEGDGRAFGELLGSTVAPTLIVWLLFYVFVFRKRASFGKSLAVFLLMATMTAAAVVTPLFLLAQGAKQEAAIERDLQAGAQTRLDALSQKLRADIAALQIPPNALQGLHNGDEADARLELIHRAQAIMTNHVAAVDAEMTATRARMEAAALSPRRKARALSDFDAENAPDAEFRHALALDQRLMASMADILVFMSQNKRHWQLQGEAYLFDDPALVQKFNDLVKTHEISVAEFNALKQQHEAAQARNAGGP